MDINLAQESEKHISVVCMEKKVRVFSAKQRLLQLKLYTLITCVHDMNFTSLKNWHTKSRERERIAQKANIVWEKIKASSDQKPNSILPIAWGNSNKRELSAVESVWRRISILHLILISSSCAVIYAAAHRGRLLGRDNRLQLNSKYIYGVLSSCHLCVVFRKWNFREATEQESEENGNITLKHFCVYPSQPGR